MLPLKICPMLNAAKTLPLNLAAKIKPLKFYSTLSCLLFYSLVRTLRLIIEMQSPNAGKILQQATHLLVKIHKTCMVLRILKAPPANPRTKAFLVLKLDLT